MRTIRMRTARAVLCGVLVGGAALSAAPAGFAGRGVMEYFGASVSAKVATAVVTGPFSDWGVVHIGASGNANIDLVELQKGSFKLAIGALNRAVKLSLDLATCSYDQLGTAQVKVFGGSGAYAHISGVLTITFRAYGILRRSGGTCETQTVAAVGTGSGSGPISY